MYVSAHDLPLPSSPLCGLRLTGLIFMELLSDLHAAHMGATEEAEEEKEGVEKFK